MPELVEFHHVISIRVAQTIRQVFVVVEGGAAAAKEIVPIYPIRLGAGEIVRHLPVPRAIGVVVLDLDPILAGFDLTRCRQIQLRQHVCRIRSAARAHNTCVRTDDLAVVTFIRTTAGAVLIDGDVVLLRIGGSVVAIDPHGLDLRLGGACEVRPAAGVVAAARRVVPADEAVRRGRQFSAEARSAQSGLWLKRLSARGRLHTVKTRNLRGAEWNAMPACKGGRTHESCSAG